ncbi:hypothetical protein LCGC14_0951190 [marine sediment metagenome]|uniref:Uncharacterized protein n=1 Tax=marine sediment metagenome TaxID=412755 RepID=A0A0F9NLX7_9ZZZZ
MECKHLNLEHRKDGNIHCIDCGKVWFGKLTYGTLYEVDLPLVYSG